MKYWDGNQKISFRNLVEEMVQEDYKISKRNELIRNSGYSIFRLLRMTSLNSPKKIFVAGHNGMVGSALVNQLKKKKEVKLIKKSKINLDLTDQIAVNNFFKNESPDEVYLAAAKVGGILANNQYPAEFIANNLSIQLNVIESAFHNGVKKLFFWAQVVYIQNLPLSQFKRILSYQVS